MAQLKFKLSQQLLSKTNISVKCQLWLSKNSVMSQLRLSKIKKLNFPPKKIENCPKIRPHIIANYQNWDIKSNSRILYTQWRVWKKTTQNGCNVNLWKRSVYRERQQSNYELVPKKGGLGQLHLGRKGKGNWKI